MYAIEFETIPEDGKIILPFEYRGIKNEMKVIILTKYYTEETNVTKKMKFSAAKIHTKNFKFDRDEANAR